ncbi:hypothetical protein [Marinicella sp. W31]|uniref:hypothetical protein n=1 Tax=Marinicella sp. W31 TaxID=3023713 RepID=UPI003757AC89
MAKIVTTEKISWPNATVILRFRVSTRHPVRIVSEAIPNSDASGDYPRITVGGRNNALPTESDVTLNYRSVFQEDVDDKHLLIAIWFIQIDENDAKYDIDISLIAKYREGRINVFEQSFDGELSDHVDYLMVKIPIE